MEEFFQILTILIITFFLSQGVKWLLDFIKHKKVLWSENGGMPSSHTALLVSLTTSVALYEGFNILFLSLSLITILFINDALAVRWEASKHSIFLNKLTKTNKFNIVGHKPLEVIVGFIIGLLIPLLFYVLTL